MLILVAFICGGLCTYFILGMINIIHKNKHIQKIKDAYNELYNNVLTDKVYFNNRYDDTIFLNTTLSLYGEVEIIMYLGKKEVFIIKDNVTLFTSELIDYEQIDKMKRTIIVKHKTDICNTIELNGKIYYKNDYDIKIKEVFNKIISEFDISFDSDPNIHNILKNIRAQNIKTKYNLNDILDKINKVGYDNLTLDEKEFLKNIEK